MKDKSLKDEKQYLIQFYDPIKEKWVKDSTYSTLKALKIRLKHYRDFDKRNGVKHKYRTVRITIKKEVIG